jgi:hypothetical protein
MAVARAALIAVAGFALSGCGFYLPADVAKPGDITLENAMRDTGRSLVALRNELREGQYRSGLIADEVTVAFNISAGANMENKLTIDATQPAKAGAFLLTGLKDEFTLSNAAARGNTITIKLKNIYTIEANKIALADYSRGRRPNDPPFVCPMNKRRVGNRCEDMGATR